jgi:glycosyltransferase involved in cell wall biosynthesis
MQKTILLIGNHLSNFGQNMGIGEVLAQKLRRLGWSILLTSNHGNKFCKLLDMLITIYSKQHKFEVAQIDVFSGNAFYWAYLSGRLLKKLKKPFILTLHGGNLPEFSEKNPRRVKELFGWANVVTSPSNYLLNQFSKYRPDILLINNGIEIENYLFRLREKPTAKMVWLRAFHNIYNPSLVPRMLAVLNQQGIHPHLTMIGPDKGDGSLQELLQTSADLGIKENITIIPGVPKSQVPEELSKGDIFLNTTNIDNTPVSVIEAMANGLCIVSTNVGGIPYLLEDGMNALLVPPDNPEAMAAAVKRILTEPRLASSLSTNARAKAELFDWSVVLPKWEELLAQMILAGKN